MVSAVGLIDTGSKEGEENCSRSMQVYLSGGCGGLGVVEDDHFQQVSPRTIILLSLSTSALCLCH